MLVTFYLFIICADLLWIIILFCPSVSCRLISFWSSAIILQLWLGISLMNRYFAHIWWSWNMRKVLLFGDIWVWSRGIKIESRVSLGTTGRCCCARGVLSKRSWKNCSLGFSPSFTFPMRRDSKGGSRKIFIVLCSRTASTEMPLW